METALFEDDDDVRHTNGNGNGNGHGAEAPTVRERRAVREETARLAAVVESMLFAAGAPVPLARLVEALDGPGRGEVTAALDALRTGYEHDGRGLRLVHVAGGYQLRTPAEHGPWVRRLLRERPPRLSRPMLETLAIVAYRQPCTRIDIEAIRGVDADAVLTTLTDRRLVRILGRKDGPGRPLLYGTTREFLEVFGLPDLGALPTLRELGDGADVLAAADLSVAGTGVLPTTADEAARAASEPAAETPPVAAPERDG
jgi:segregation and condensation protein B